MGLLNNGFFYVILYVIFETIFTQFYKIATRKMTRPGALTVLFEGIGVITACCLVPFFDMKFPTDKRVYLFLGLSVIFYAISDRLNTTVRKGLEASTFSILKQLSTTFMIVAGLLFFKEEFILHKFVGAMLIIASNVLVFYQKGEFHWNRYLIFGILANISYTIALFLDVNISNQFNLPFYVAITLGIPAILITLLERVKFSDIKAEIKNGNKKAILITGITWPLSIISMLRAYQLENVTIVAPLCALTVISNVIVGYLFLQEREHLGRKIVAGIGIVISVLLIKL